MRRESLPIQLLLEATLGKRLQILHHMDNTHAITAIKKGYSKKLRHLQRTHRVCIGLLHECSEDPEIQMKIVHCPTVEMKADMFTKALNAPNFVDALKLIGMKTDKKSKL